jgi:hypothetical protein
MLNKIHEHIINTILQSQIILFSEKSIKQDIIECCIVKEKKCVYDTTDCLENQFKEEIEYTCNICLSLFDNPVLLPCGHTFCNNCVYSCKQKKCSLCRHNFWYTDLVPNNSILELINKKYKFGRIICL